MTNADEKDGQIAPGSPNCDDARALHNIVVLTLAQSFNYALAPLAVAIGGLTGSYLLGPDKTFATLPITCFVLGPLFGALPAALLMRRIGRRGGFLIGSALGFFGCLFATIAILDGSFAGFCAALGMIGVSISFAQQYRFAAADFGSPGLRTRGLSWVMGGGLIAAVLGPQTAILLGDYFSPILFAGSYAGGMALSLIGFIVLLFLKPLPVSTGDTAKIEKPARPLGEIVRQPLFLTALACAGTSYMSMTLVMTAAPIAMIFCGYSPEQSTTSIQFHVLAMFAPSFFTGSLIVRFGHAPVIATGLILFLVAAVIGASGIDLSHFRLSLIALGLAWNFGYIGGTSLVTKTYEPHERSKVQGLFDSLVFGSTALMSLLSGVLINAAGWQSVLAIVLPLISLGGLVLWQSRARFRRLAI